MDITKSLAKLSDDALMLLIEVDNGFNRMADAEELHELRTMETAGLVSHDTQTGKWMVTIHGHDCVTYLVD